MLPYFSFVQLFLVQVCHFSSFFNLAKPIFLTVPHFLLSCAPLFLVPHFIYYITFPLFLVVLVFLHAPLFLSLCHFSSNFFSLQSQISSLSYISYYLMHHFSLFHISLSLLSQFSFMHHLSFHFATFPCFFTLQSQFPSLSHISCCLVHHFSLFHISLCRFPPLSLSLLSYFSFVQLFFVIVRKIGFAR